MSKSDAAPFYSRLSSTMSCSPWTCLYEDFACVYHSSHMLQQEVFWKDNVFKKKYIGIQTIFLSILPTSCHQSFYFFGQMLLAKFNWHAKLRCIKIWNKSFLRVDSSLCITCLQKKFRISLCLLCFAFLAKTVHMWKLSRLF